MPSEIVKKCSKLLLENRLTIAFAESVTAGRLSAEFSLVENAGKFLKCSLVSYDAGVKQDNLRVKKFLIDEFSPESMEVAQAMTYGMRDLFPADIYVSTTGLNAPGGSETPEKPVGSIFIHGLVEGNEILHKVVFDGTPEEIMLKAVDRVAYLVHDILKLK